MMRPVPALACSLLLAVTPALAQPKPEFGEWGVELAAMDRAVRPGDNFFRYVNGGWLAQARIPDERAATGSFQDLQVSSEERLKTIVTDLERAQEPQLSAEERKLRNLYRAFMDMAGIEARGLAPIKKDLDYFASLQTSEDVARAMGSMRLPTLSIFNIAVRVDDRDPGSYALTFSQSGLGMPERDYYLSNNAVIVRVRQAYRKYLADMMTLAGMDDVEARADRVLAVETEIAKVSWNRADRRDADKIYNPMPASALKTLAPDFAWDVFLSEGTIPLKKPDGNERYVIVAEKTAFGPLATIFKNTPVSTWRDYLAVHYLHGAAPYLPKRFDDLVFSFYGKVLTGRTKQLDRQTRAMHLLDQQMGDALGMIYVARYFPSQTRNRAGLIASSVIRAYETAIPLWDWMSPATRTKALDKLHQLTLKIGSPVKWRDYMPLQIIADDPVGNAQRAGLFEWKRDISRIDQPVDRGEWGLTPSSINAYYNPSFNEVVFPAGILQPPFFDPGADDAVNYGAIGAMMATKISQAFDDTGSLYDGRGVVRDWWTRQDRANFNTRTAALVEQYDAFEPLPGLHVKGQNTLGENIADNAGLAIALKAYRLSLNGKPAPVLDGYTGDQRLFLSFGQVWRTKMRDSAIRTQTMSNEHTVAEFRVIGPTRNQDAWYDSFDVKPGEKYYLAPAERVHLW